MLYGGEPVPPALSEEEMGKKICDKLDLDDGACKAIMKCAKEGTLRECMQAAAAAAATAGCAALGVGMLSPVCGSIAAKFVGMVGTTGYITGCYFGPQLYELPGDLTDMEIIKELSIGEYATGPFPRLDNKIIVSVMTQAGSGCASYLPENLIKDIDFLRYYTTHQPGIQLADYYRAARDWDGQAYTYRSGMWVGLPQPPPSIPEPYLPQATQATQSMQSMQPMQLYPAGTVGVYDGARGRFVLLTPTE